MDLRQIGTRERERERDGLFWSYSYSQYIHTYDRGGVIEEKISCEKKGKKIRNIIEILSDARAVQPV